MKKVDFENGRTIKIILSIAVPMLVAQILNLLYSIVDRIYIARIPEIGTAALGAVGLCFPVFILIMAFTNMYGSGGAPLFSIARGQKNTEEARIIQNTSFFLIVTSAVFLTIFGEVFGKGILSLFGASDATMVYALPYLRIYLTGTIFSMISTGMNSFITAQGFAVAGMTTIVLGAVSNIILDPIFIFVFGLGIEGAAIATVISQALSAIYVLSFFFGKRAEIPLHMLSLKEIGKCGDRVKRIVGLGTASFIMQFTNAAVNIACNNVLADVGGDIYVSIMTIVNSARQIMETPIYAISEGASPVVSYNYGARRGGKVKHAIMVMFMLELTYSLALWIFIRIFPEYMIGIFSSDKTIMEDAIPAFHLYFSTFIFMTFQHTGQATFKSLGMKNQAIFFSLFRKAMIVVPLTYILPYLFHMGTDGVFAAEPISNVIGGLACFITMLLTVRNIMKSEDL